MQVIEKWKGFRLEKFPVSSFQFRVSSFQFRVSSFQFPVSSFQFPVSSFQFPVSSFEFPVSRLIELDLKAKELSEESILFEKTYFHHLDANRCFIANSFDFKIQNDTNELIENRFLTGPGFQMAQIFTENVFEKHINWN